MVSTYIGSSKFNKNMTFDSISCGDFKMHNYPKLDTWLVLETWLLLEYPT